MARASPITRRMGGSPERPSAIFSATVNASNSEKCWCTIPMPRRRAVAGSGIVTARPSQ